MRDLVTMQERLESLFGRAAPGWVPPVDLSEGPDDFVLTVEVPGLRREDVNIEATPDAVTVRGNRPPQSCCPERYQQLERGQGQFSRSFRFTSQVVPDGIKADLAEGVLTVRIPKAATPAAPIDVR
ncbi:MAG TPA: Hsp20/alpha crystallin family protein [Vicinamibacterales bacterium]|nr:Hsp20/alpha crystallin family protein [Vicinamibacterales bacterium]